MTESLMLTAYGIFLCSVAFITLNIVDWLITLSLKLYKKLQGK